MRVLSPERGHRMLRISGLTGCQAQLLAVPGRTSLLAHKKRAPFSRLQTGNVVTLPSEATYLGGPKECQR